MPDKNTNLYLTELPEEVVVYVVSSQMAHSLNEPAGLIFKACDGATPVAEVTRRIAERYNLSSAQSEAVVGDTLEKFQDLGLLESGNSRRRFLTTAAAAVPLAIILSMAAPAPAAAASAGGMVS